MTQFQLLVQPLILVPGVALLILSTATRLNPIEAAWRHELSRTPAKCSPAAAVLGQRMILLRYSFLALYGAIATLVSASLAGAILNVLGRNLTIVMVALTCLAFLLVLVSLTTLLREVSLIARMTDDTAQHSKK